jgi:hypothetical protein
LTRALLAGVAVVTRVRVEIHYLQKTRSRKARRKVPLFEMSAGLAAFAAWSTSVPDSPSTRVGGFTTRWGLVIALVTAGGLPTASELREALAGEEPRRAQAAAS